MKRILSFLGTWTGAAIIVILFYALVALLVAPGCQPPNQSQQIQPVKPCPGPCPCKPKSIGDHQ